MGKETSQAVKKLATMVAEKRGEPYAITMGLLRCRLALSLIRSAIICFRGTRKCRNNNDNTDDTNARLIVKEAAVTV